MSNWNESKEFKALEKEWEKRLKDSGFEDIEKKVGHEHVLQQRASNSYRQANKTVRQAKLSYYEQLADKVHNEKFDHPVEKVIMLKLSEGCNIKEICAELKKLDDPRCRGYRQTVRFIIRKYEQRWGIKKWKASQLKIKKWQAIRS